MNESPRRPGGSWKTTFSPFLPFSFLIPLFFPGISEFSGFLTFFPKKGVTFWSSRRKGSVLFGQNGMPCPEEGHEAVFRSIFSKSFVILKARVSHPENSPVLFKADAGRGGSSRRLSSGRTSSVRKMRFLFFRENSESRPITRRQGFFSEGEGACPDWVSGGIVFIDPSPNFARSRDPTDEQRGARGT